MPQVYECEADTVALDSADIEAIALRVAELVAMPLERFVDARTLASELGVSREWVYMNADALGAIRLGSGPKARLRFDASLAREAVAHLREEVQAPPQQPSRRRGRPPKATGLAPGAQLLRGRTG